MTDKPKPKRRWMQFSLRTLLIVVTVFCIGFGWLGLKLKEGREQRNAIVAIRELGGRIGYEHEVDRSNPPGPEWLRQLIGDEYFFSVGAVQLTGSKVNDTSLSIIERFTDLKWLTLIGTKVTDAGLEHLKGLTNLQGLSIQYAEITDTGLEHLKGLTKLQTLHLNHTKITDAGLEHLTELSNLRALSLRNTKITDEGLIHLRRLTRLDYLSLVDVFGVTPEGVKKLQQALPNCNIDH